MRKREKLLTRRQFFEISAAGTAYISSKRDFIDNPSLLRADSIQGKSSKVKIWPDEQKQTIGFELSELPHEIFKIVIPELVSDAKEPIIPWEQPSPNWQIGENSAQWSTENHNAVRMESD